jgi:aryl-alcohol dehydrogenase-like predicted oxidoreductase
LRALGTDYVDIYQVQWPDPATPIEATAEALDAFVKEGLVRYVGVSNYDAHDMAAFQRVRAIDTLQPPYHVFRRDIEASIVPYARKHGIGILVYGALAHGLLSGRMNETTTFPPDDWRSASNLFTGAKFQRNLQVIRNLAEFASRRGATVAQLAIAWTLANPAVDVAIVGARSAEQIRQTAPGASLELTAEEMTEIDSILHGETAVDAPVPETTMRTSTSGDTGSRPSPE